MCVLYGGGFVWKGKLKFIVLKVFCCDCRFGCIWLDVM